MAPVTVVLNVALAILTLDPDGYWGHIEEQVCMVEPLSRLI